MAPDRKDAPRVTMTDRGPDLELVQVAGDVPAGVLIVHVSSRQVVHANSVAEQFAPGMTLPCGIDDWSDAAALRDLDGQELSGTTSPLSLVAQSLPLHGRGVSAARPSELGPRREPLWVVGLPMTDAPGLDDQALVVFLPLRHREDAQAAADAAAVVAEVRDRAVLATGLSFTVADARAEDVPLIWVNPAFTMATGHSFEDAVGRNCRFLQGPGTDPTAVVALRDAVAGRRDVTVTLLNYRKDGTAFWNQVSMSPVSGPDGEVTHFVGIQTDVTARVDADRQRDEALAAERVARRDAEQAHAQLALLAEATSRLAATLDVTECLDRLANLVVPALADWVVLVTADRHGEIDSAIARHRDGREEEMARYAELVHSRVRNSPFDDVLAGRPARRFDAYGSAGFRDERDAWASREVQALGDAFGLDSVVFVPLPGRRHVIGGMGLVRRPGREPFSDSDLTVATDLGRRAGLTLDNARLYQAEHRVAETLQRSLLPSLPGIPGLTAAARYLASESAAEVGGDFYELIALPDGAVGLAIGDVVGHDVLAAAAMGHLRGLLRACAWDSGMAEVSADPAQVLTRVDRLVQGLDATTMATATFARLERIDGTPVSPDADGPVAATSWRLRWSNAGHPPLLVRLPDGSVEALEGPEDLMLGVGDFPRASAERVLPPGSTVLAYTDGLVERRNESLNVGLARLRERLADGPQHVEALCDYLVAELGNSEDDVALLALQL